MADRIVNANVDYRKNSSFDGKALAELLDQTYLAKRRPPKFTKKVSFAPSSLGYTGACPRYWSIAFNGAEFVDVSDSRGMANMENGSYAHDRLQKLFEESGILVAKEVEMTLQDPPVRGYIDVMVRWGDEVLPGEIKTTLSVGFMHRRSKMAGTAPHLVQVLIYMKATGKRTGFLLYEDKDSQEIIVIPVEMTDSNEKILNDVLDWMRLVHLNFQESQEEGQWEAHLPKRPWTKKNKVCKGCPVFNECWNVQPEGTLVIKPLELPKL